MFGSRRPWILLLQMAKYAIWHDQISIFNEPLKKKMTSRLMHTSITVLLEENLRTIHCMKPWKTQNTKGLVEATSLKVRMGHSRTACKCSTSVFKDLWSIECGRDRLSRTDGAEKFLAARQTVPVACVSDDLKCGKGWEACDNRSRTLHIWSLGKRRA